MSKNTLNTAEGVACLKIMTGALTHRGPDSEGHWNDPDQGVFLGHRRLSILDLSDAGAQPIVSHCGRFVMVYNGEIYNTKPIIEMLRAQNANIAFNGHSDSEVLLESLARLGLKQTLQLIKGMFAIALWDRQEKILTLVRDHIGKKPIYVGWVDSNLAFASELKALQKLSSNSLKIDRKALDQYKYFGFIPGRNSIYQHVYKLEPGHYLTLGPSDIQEKKTDIVLEKMTAYWSAQNLGSSAKTPYQPDDLKRILSQAVADRMVSDVPLGAFLSGGVDSSLVTALMQAQSQQPIKSYSIGFENTKFDESRHAEKVAAHLGTDHTTYMVNAEECQKIIPDLPRIYDEPFADYSQIPTAVLCHQARKDTVVAISGDGGDEVFCGYKRYFMLKRLLDAASPWPSGIRKILALALSLPPQGLYNGLGANGKRIHSIAGFLQENGFDNAVLRTLCMDPSVTQPKMDLGLGDLKDLERMMMIDTKLYLPDDILVKVDRASMFSSLEVRSPLLDKDVIEYAWSMPISDKVFPDKTRGKKPLYDLLCQYVPQDLIDRPKQGFTPPIADWLRGDLREWAEDLLHTNTGLYKRTDMQLLWQEFISGQVDHHNALWCILMAQSWYQFNVEHHA